MSIFGPIIPASALEDAMLSLLQKWLPTYIAATERQNGLTAGQLPLPRSWNVVNDPDNWPENQLPSVLIVSSGSDGEPERQGDGMYSMWWSLGIAVMAAANDERHARRNAQFYTAAVYALLTDRGSLDGFAAATELSWVRFDAGAMTGRNRTLGVGSSQWRVKVENVVQANQGPVAPDPKPDHTEPYDDGPSIQAVSLDLMNRGTSS